MSQQPLALPENPDIASVHKPLYTLIRTALDNYFAHLDKNMPPKNIYQMVMEEAEIPLLESTLAYTKGNQCLAAEILGISRSTLRKKLKQYRLLK